MSARSRSSAVVVGLSPSTAMRGTAGWRLSASRRPIFTPNRKKRVVLARALNRAREVSGLQGLKVAPMAPASSLAPRYRTSLYGLPPSTLRHRTSQPASHGARLAR